MGVEEFKAAQRALGFETNSGFARELGVSLSSIDKWRSGAVDVPKPIAKLIRLMIRMQEHRS